MYISLSLYIYMYTYVYVYMLRVFYTYIQQAIGSARKRRISRIPCYVMLCYVML